MGLIVLLSLRLLINKWNEGEVKQYLILQSCYLLNLIVLQC